MLRRLFSRWRKKEVDEPQQIKEDFSTVDPDEDDRRAWTRHISTVQTHVASLRGEKQRLEANIVDVSRGGIKLTVNQKIEAGEMLNIEIPPEEDSQSSSTALACVVHVHQLDSGEWNLGCAFSEELNDDDLRGFGIHRPKSGIAEKRDQVRFACNVKASFERTDDESQTWEAQVSNISSGGVALVVDSPIDNGTVLNLRLRSGTRDEERKLLACVVHVTEQSDDKVWLLGCNFIRELSQSDLKALL